MTTAWNPSDKGSGIALSNGSLTATATVGGGWPSVRATRSRASGKQYYEAVFSAGTDGNVIIGLATSSANTGTYCGGDLYGWGWGHSGALKFHNAVQASLGTAPAANDILMLAWDADAGNLWFGKNGTWFGTGNPATGANPHYTSVTGTMFPMGSLFTIGNAITANFGATAFSYTPPSGFSGWDTIVDTTPISGMTIKAVSRPRIFRASKGTVFIAARPRFIQIPGVHPPLFTNILLPYRQPFVRRHEQAVVSIGAIPHYGATPPATGRNAAFNEIFNVKQVFNPLIFNE